jgi:hypothetical protein
MRPFVHLGKEPGKILRFSARDAMDRGDWAPMERVVHLTSGSTSRVTTTWADLGILPTSADSYSYAATPTEIKTHLEEEKYMEFAGHLHEGPIARVADGGCIRQRKPAFGRRPRPAMRDCVIPSELSARKSLFEKPRHEEKPEPESDYDDADPSEPESDFSDHKGSEPSEDEEFDPPTVVSGGPAVDWETEMKRERDNKIVSDRLAERAAKLLEGGTSKARAAELKAMHSTEIEGKKEAYAQVNKSVEDICVTASTGSLSETAVARRKWVAERRAEIEARAKELNPALDRTGGSLTIRAPNYTWLRTLIGDVKSMDHTNCSGAARGYATLGEVINHSTTCRSCDDLLEKRLITAILDGWLVDDTDISPRDLQAVLRDGPFLPYLLGQVTVAWNNFKRKEIIKMVNMWYKLRIPYRITGVAHIDICEDGRTGSKHMKLDATADTLTTAVQKRAAADILHGDIGSISREDHKMITKAIGRRLHVSKKPKESF